MIIANTLTGRKEIDSGIRQFIENKFGTLPPEVKGFYYSKNRLTIRSLNVYVNDIMYFLGCVEKPVKEITRIDIDKFFNDLIAKLETKNECSTREQELYSVLKQFFQYCADERFIDTNVFANVERPKRKKRLNPAERQDFMTKREAEQYLYNVRRGVGSAKAQAFREHSRYRDIAIIELFLYTGMRLSALRELNVSDIDFKAGSVTVTTKGKKVQKFYLDAQLLDDLKLYLNQRNKMEVETPALFLSSRKQRMSIYAIESVIIKYTEDIKWENGIQKRITPHKLRATFATLMYSEHKDMVALSSILGHEQLTTTQIYVRGLMSEINNYTRKSSALYS